MNKDRAYIAYRLESTLEALGGWRKEGDILAADPRFTILESQLSTLLTLVNEHVNEGKDDPT